MSEIERPHPRSRRVRKFFTKRLARFAAAVVPLVYVFYMNLVWRTSRVDMFGVAGMVNARRRHGGVICVLWHETVFFVAFAFRELSASTLASESELGQLITNMLQRCRFVVFRGGSGKKKTRPTRVLRALIEHMREYRDVSYGLTVDGSRGPRHVMKPGAVALARATGAPLFTVHVACRPLLRAPTWDRTIIPLPFSRIAILFEGPVFCEAALTPAELPARVQALESSLHATAEKAETFLDAGGPPPSSEDRRDGVWLLRAGEHLRPVRRTPGVLPLPAAGTLAEI